MKLMFLPIFFMQIKSYIEIKKAFFLKIFWLLLLLAYNIIIYYLVKKGQFIIVKS